VPNATASSLNSKLQAPTSPAVLFKTDVTLVSDTEPVNHTAYTQSARNRFLPAPQISCCVWYWVPSHSVNI
jgi:hypothetical protein